MDGHTVGSVWLGMRDSTFLKQQSTTARYDYERHPLHLEALCLSPHR